MKQIRRGYRLTPEEEAILHGEGVAETDRETAGAQEFSPEKNTERKKTGGALTAVLAALLLMIGLAYLFFYLIGGGTDDRPVASRADALYSAVRKEFAHLVFAPLSDAERALLRRKLSLTPEEEDRFWPVFYEFANRSEQAAAIHESWLSALAAEAENIRLTKHFKNQYIAVYKEYISISEYYSVCFAEILSADRASWVFVGFAEIRRNRMDEKL